MPVPLQRDERGTRDALRDWLAARLPDCPELAVSPLSTPLSNGFSSETLLLDAVWSGGRCGLVVHVEATTRRLFLDHRIAPQFHVLRALAERTDVPVPRVRWLETDPAVIGAPFYVMDRVAGRVPPDSPPYAYAGWVADLSPPEREAMWWSGIEAMARAHAVDWRALGLDRWLVEPRRGGPADQQLGYWREFQRWTYLGAVPRDARDELAWLEANRPHDEPTGLVWGDARLGNQMFEGTRCVALLDWEMVGLGNPEADLAWFLTLDRMFGGGYGARLPGIPSPDETVEGYERLSGRPVRNLDYYERFTEFRLSTIMRRSFRPGGRGVSWL